MLTPVFIGLVLAAVNSHVTFICDRITGWDQQNVLRNKSVEVGDKRSGVMFRQVPDEKVYSCFKKLNRLFVLKYSSQSNFVFL